MPLKKNFTLLITALATLFALAACNDYQNSGFQNEALKSEAGYATEAAAPAASYNQDAAPATEESQTSTNDNNILNTKQLNDNTALPPKTQIIKTADIRFQVQNVEKTQKNIAQLAQKSNAYISSENGTKTGNFVEYQMVIRTNKNFDSLINQVLTQSIYTDYKRITSEDVTEQYTDIATRLKTKKEVEQRYLAILKQSAKITDILSVERELKQIREEIEAAEGKLRYLSDRIAYSTLTVNFYEKLNYVPTPAISFFNRLYEGIYNGFQGLLDMIIGVASNWHLILFATIIFFLIKRWWTKKPNSNSFFGKKNKKTPPPPNPPTQP